MMFKVNSRGTAYRHFWAHPFKQNMHIDKSAFKNGFAKNENVFSLFVAFSQPLSVSILSNTFITSNCFSHVA